MKTLTLTTHSPDESLALGERLGRAARPGDVVALYGDLGAGKTLLTKGIMSGLDGNADEVTSPTFVLMLRHQGRMPLYHFDAYRLSRVTELLDIGAEEAFYGDGLSVIEWADRVADALPPERLDIHLEVAGESDRQMRFEAVGHAGQAFLGRTGLYQ